MNNDDKGGMGFNNELIGGNATRYILDPARTDEELGILELVMAISLNTNNRDGSEKQEDVENTYDTLERIHTELKTQNKEIPETLKASVDDSVFNLMNSNYN